MHFCFIPAKSVDPDDPDEMLHYAAFHLGHHCLPKYQFVGIKNGLILQFIAHVTVWGFAVSHEHLTLLLCLML